MYAQVSPIQTWIGETCGMEVSGFVAICFEKNCISHTGCFRDQLLCISSSPFDSRGSCKDDPWGHGYGGERSRAS